MIRPAWTIALGGFAWVVVLAACLTASPRRDPIESCRDDLRGVYAAGDERWMVLDDGDTLEAYPIVPDAAGAADGVFAAPRVIDFARSSTIDGTIQRRYMQRDRRCDARAPAHITRCSADTLELVIGEPTAPLGFAPCTWPAAPPSRVVRWQRQPR